MFNARKHHNYSLLLFGNKDAKSLIPNKLADPGEFLIKNQK